MIEEEQIKFYFFQGQSKNLWLSVPFCKAELSSRAKDILSTQRHFKRRQLSFDGRLRWFQAQRSETMLSNLVLCVEPIFCCHY